MALVLTACDSIDEDDRITKGEPEIHPFNPSLMIAEKDGEYFNVTNQHTLLIEDYTGWKCTNCPQMSEFIDQKILNIYPSIVVGMHSEANTQLSSSQNMKFTLSTPVVDEIAQQYYGLNMATESLPLVSLNREYNKLGKKYVSGLTSESQDALSTLAYDLFLEHNIEHQSDLVLLSQNITKGSDDRSFEISTFCYSAKPQDVMLELWVIENDYVAIQMGAPNMLAYPHNHVFRQTVNGVAGEKISTNDEGVVVKHRCTLAENVSVPENCEVVAIVSDPSTHRVINCHKTKLF